MSNRESLIASLYQAVNGSSVQADSQSYFNASTGTLYADDGSLNKAIALKACALVEAEIKELEAVRTPENESRIFLKKLMISCVKNTFGIPDATEVGMMLMGRK